MRFQSTILITAILANEIEPIEPIKKLDFDLEFEAIVQVLNQLEPVNTKTVSIWDSLNPKLHDIAQFDWSFLPTTLDLLDQPTLGDSDEKVSLKTQALLGLHHLSTVNHTKSLDYLGSITLYGLYETTPNLKQSYLYYQRMSDLNDPKGNRIVGLLYATGLGIERSYPKALIYTSFAAYAGDMPAMHTLGYWHHAGIGVPKHCVRSYVYYEKVARHLYAKFKSGPPGGLKLPNQPTRMVEGLYGKGASGSGNPSLNEQSGVRETDILLLYRLQAEAGDIVSQYMLGQYHYTGTDTLAVDYKKAIEYFQLAIKSTPKPTSGESKRQSQIAISRSYGYIGTMYLRGEGVEVDYALAKQYFESGIEKENPMSYTGLAMIYLQGLGVEKDVVKGIELLTEGSNSGHAYGKVLLAEHMIASGKDISKAIPLLESAAKKGQVLAFYHLGLLHYSSASVMEANCKTAMTYLKAFVEKAHFLDEPVLKRAHEATKKDEFSSAVVGYTLAAERGYEIAQFNAAWILENVELSSQLYTENGKIEQMKQALVLYQRSANQGFVDSRVRVGDLYYYGYGWGVGSVPQPNQKQEYKETVLSKFSAHVRGFFYPPLEPDYKSSVNHYLAAAEGDVGLSSVAMFNLGFMYQNGLGIEQVLQIN